MTIPITVSLSVSTEKIEYTMNVATNQQTISMKVDSPIIAKIPSNYGLITWDGSTLTVS